MMSQNVPILRTDGTCVLCNGFVQFIFKIDKGEQIHFASLTEAQKENNSLIFYINGKEYYRSDAVIKLFSQIGGIWKVLAIVMLIFPKLLRDIVYTWIANNRYRFGKQKCTLPTDAQKARIVD